MLVTLAVLKSLVDQVGAPTVFQKPPITNFLVDALHVWNQLQWSKKLFYQKVAAFLEHYSWFLMFHLESKERLHRHGTSHKPGYSGNSLPILL